MISGSNNAPPPAYQTEGVLPDGLYVLTNIMSRTVLDLRWGSSSAGTRCAGYSLNTNERIDHQLWIVKHDSSNDTYTLRNFRGGTYLDLEAGKRENGSQVTGYPRVLAQGSRRSQEWRIIEQVSTQHRSRYRIQCSATNTCLEIAGGNMYNGTYATCSAWVVDGDHQLWALERVSRTTGEIKALLASWKSGLLDRLFQPYGDDAQYFVLPYELRKSIWERTNLQRQTIRKHVFDYDNFVTKAKDAVISWGRDRLLLDEYSILFGVVYGNARTGPKAYNWYLSNGMHDLVFFDPQTGQEFPSAALDAIRFEHTFATL